MSQEGLPVPQWSPCAVDPGSTVDPVHPAPPDPPSNPDQPPKPASKSGEPEQKGHTAAAIDRWRTRPPDRRPSPHRLHSKRWDYPERRSTKRSTRTAGHGPTVTERSDRNPPPAWRRRVGADWRELAASLVPQLDDTIRHDSRTPNRVVFGSRRRLAAPLARRCGVRRPRPSA
jgi:hypothetical protein